MSSSEKIEYDCVSCGRCCYHNEPNYALLYPEDIEAFGPSRLAAYTTKSTRSGKAQRPGEDDFEIYMRMENGHCCALNVFSENSYACSIYEDRPLLCRVFEPGNSECLAARARPTREVPPNRKG